LSSYVKNPMLDRTDCATLLSDTGEKTGMTEVSSSMQTDLQPLQLKDCIAVPRSADNPMVYVDAGQFLLFNYDLRLRSLHDGAMQDGQPVDPEDLQRLEREGVLLEALGGVRGAQNHYPAHRTAVDHLHEAYTAIRSMGDMGLAVRALALRAQVSAWHRQFLHDRAASLTPYVRASERYYAGYRTLKTEKLHLARIAGFRALAEGKESTKLQTVVANTRSELGVCPAETFFAGMYTKL
jgi:hypothetical protein